MKTEIILETVRHSLSHIMAAAVQELYPGVKFGIGPAIENGFYYDFALPSEALAKEGLSLPKIELKMKEIIKKDVVFKKKKISKKEANKLFAKKPYKLELIKELKEKEISVYQSGNFIDLCKGPHVKSSKEIPLDSFKLTKLAGAYWRGSEKNPMLTRIYGLAFESKTKLDEYVKLQEEAEKRDHRILGQKLELFLIDEEVGAGLPIWLPKGAILRKIIEDYLYQELTNQKYDWLYTPHIGNLNLWKTSGHWNFYKENMYSPIKIDEEEYLLKPMNCPFHVKAYNFKIRSYRDLPLFFAELGTVYRYERSGTLHGLTRVRGFTQDDAHTICTPKQMPEELANLLEFALKVLKTFGFEEYTIYLSTKPEKYAGSDENWKKATDTLKNVIENLKLSYKTDPGGGVFYGPKIDIKIKDSLQREWQCTTIQFDFNLPERFKMTYIDEKGKKQEPFMIHRAILGSMERFIGVLLEHYAGNLPLWLSPVQVWVVPIGSDHRQYAEEVQKKLKSLGIRTEAKTEAETVSKKIREGEIQKIPYILVVGDKEIKANSVRVRQRQKGDIGEIKFDEFIEKTILEIEKKIIF
ncbi:MAG: threonine--tRNA ligase [Candidatus Nealsonbacteria bacterium]|nr:threonine--tRNA ligase [Candidatus Nealsonbacteria bacterium]